MVASLVPVLKNNGTVFWWSAPRLALSNGAAVTAWANNISNAVTGVQGTAGLQPAYNTNKSNGYPAVDFSGSNAIAVANQDIMRITTSFMFLCAVDIPNMLSANQTLFSKGNAASLNYAMQLNRTAPGKVSFFNGSVWIDSPLTFSKTGSECLVIGIFFNGSTYSFYGGDIPLGTAANSTSITSTTQNAVIGAQGADTLDNKLTGSILNMMLCNIAPSGQSFQDSYRYFANIAGLRSI